VLLTITTTHAPATDLGYLLHKHPDRLQSFEVMAGQAHVFYPEASPERCTAALLLEIDPITLVRGPKNGSGSQHSKPGEAELAQYVNDRPYAASSMLAVALKEAFRTALTGRCDARPELAVARLPLAIHVPALRCRGGTGRGGGARLAEAIFAPLGWAVQARPQPLEPAEWGDSPYVDVTLTGEFRLADALNHLYVLLPVLDDVKHYWVSTEEVDKLVRASGDWLAAHPEKDLITRRYLRHRRALTRSALARLAEADDTAPEELDNAVPDPDSGEGTTPEAAPPAAPATQARPLATQRREAILAVLRERGARRVGDLGCGSGVLVRDLLAERSVDHVIAVDVSARALALATRDLRLDQMPDRQRERLTLAQSSLTYRDDRLAGLDAAVLMEVIEHLDPDRLPALERVVFGYAAPTAVVVTTPNTEYNPHYPTLEPGTMRHPDHRFEWTRAQFRAWAERVAGEHGYQVAFRPVGPEHPDAGPPTQLAVFDRAAPGQAASSGQAAAPGQAADEGAAR
jgi:3' terminal RNA ribose 2'-O-methyltransferase Hen1